MKNIVIIPNPNKDTDFSVTKAALDILCRSGANVYIDRIFENDVQGRCLYYDRVPENAELIAVVGGDGSMLDAAVCAIEKDIPIVGINLGKVGYLSEIEPNDLGSLSKIVDGKYYIYEKMLLKVCKCDGDSFVYSDRLAVNDVVIGHDSYLGISEFTISTNEGALRYRADGMILSTPAGSTAYSFSAGGPIVSHKVGAILATPVCPHSFFDRSILFGTNDEITIKNTGANNLNVSADGRCFSSLEAGEACVISASERKLKVLSFKTSNMFSQLFEKMRIMEDFK